ncbi:phosphoribosylamine--glycine ligase [Rhodospirillum rubrum]|uniref:Phosphoribosylamine--glycine ligase n=1 Tax=Rhodospirillum rubrum (strain ATCC 11170 / ATH 1.1.1 / DSM 467 / LMG 4362 / NCIMB 8255 / S1) TaxID=269796 RepID=Q2RWP5_RHORT|nr:phosphoribosylamine--glycine ligase [Rhodospirillum rubrum]ABC21450.1 phosphoribosylamine--glycine ligase [Rhodospirillum rubrum ATCC 11170]AEO47132.1 phosphoribosylamine--glycine ligase [Rhodospirillum rubrum F11]MBK5953044.1 phosphoribosylamine--glycine ligase [Rhodospirillum rubrum]QXG81125.1 phosphoribosylamine--glycine ligase [Rhodospirillum rubrum]HAQ01171.1 phosphoribosylamine--glycine ligase [Rhodospirillum rubrum]
MPGATPIKVLVVGSGGREHALCRKLVASPLCADLLCAPGNAGIADVARCLPVGVEEIDALVALAKAEAVGLVVVGPEAPLVLGLADKLAEAGIAVFGPSRAGALLEGSKGFMKDVLARAGVPTAWYGRFTDAGAAKAFIGEKGAPIVVKTDGLAAGKGVILCQTLEEGGAAIDLLMGERAFGEAGDEVVIEEFLVGEEASFFALCDGTRAIAFGAAQDHKAVGEGDTGPNTGGMGAYSPAPVFDKAMEAQVMAEVIAPTLRVMADMGRPFTGVLFAGIMVTPSGPKVLEFNVRFGDPECQVLLARLESDLLPVLLAAAEGRLDRVAPLVWSPETALTVVMAAKGYPGEYAKGDVIGGLAAAGEVRGAVVFHAGTRADGEGRVVAAGGRVLGVTGTGGSVREARDRAYQAVDALDWPGGFCRRDIGWRALAREEGGR